MCGSFPASLVGLHRPYLKIDASYPSCVDNNNAYLSKICSYFVIHNKGSTETKSMTMWGNLIQTVKIVINDNIIEQVTDFKYLVRDNMGL